MFLEEAGGLVQALTVLTHKLDWVGTWKEMDVKSGTDDKKEGNNLSGRQDWGDLLLLQL